MDKNMNRVRAGSLANDQMALLSLLGPTGIPGKVEVIDYTFYDSNTFTTVTAATKNFFAAASTDLLTSNFIGDGKMPQNYAFAVKGIRCVPLAGSPSADIISALKNMVLTFTLDNAKIYAQAPLINFPAGVGATRENEGTGTVNGSNGNNGIASLPSAYRLANPILLRPLQPFKVSIQADAAFTAGTSPMRWFVYLDGKLARPLI